MKFAIKAQAFSRSGFKAIGRARTEVINTNTNSLFRGAKTPSMVKARFEAFWNDLNPHSKEVVGVLSVKKK
jgi:hypothetical protein